MALDLADRYPGQSIDSDPAYPYGKAKDVSAPGAGDGTPLQADFVNDIVGFLQAMLVNGSVSPSGTPDSASTSQYMQALLRLVGGIVITPAFISGSVSNYAPTGWDTTAFARLSTNGADATILGFGSTVYATLKIIANIDPTYNIILKHNDGTQAANNRILTPTARDWTMRPGDFTILRRDLNGTCWRVVADRNAYGDLANAPYFLAQNYVWTGTHTWSPAARDIPVKLTGCAYPVGSATILQFAGVFAVSFSVNSGAWMMQLALPDGVTLTNVEFSVTHGNAGASGQMGALIFRNSRNPSGGAGTPVQLGPTKTFAAGTGDHVESIAIAADNVIDNTAYDYFVQVTGSSLAGTNPDFLRWAVCTVTDPRAGIQR